MECSGEGEVIAGPNVACRLDWDAFLSLQASLTEGACKREARVESERVGDGSAASIAVLEPGSLLLREGEVSEAPFTHMRPHTSYVHKAKVSGRVAYDGDICRLTWTLKAHVDDIYSSRVPTEQRDLDPKKPKERKQSREGDGRWYVMPMTALGGNGTEWG